jgi:hypothetical protein
MPDQGGKVYRLTKNTALGIYRIFDEGRWIAEAYSQRDADLIVNALNGAACHSGPASYFDESKPDPQPSTNGSDTPLPQAVNEPQP